MDWKFGRHDGFILIHNPGSLTGHKQGIIEEILYVNGTGYQNSQTAVNFCDVSIGSR